MQRKGGLRTTSVIRQVSFAEVANYGVDELEAFYDFVNGWPQSLIANENELQKVFDVLIIVNLVQLVLGDEFL